jgi:hypothetical protein
MKKSKNNKGGRKHKKELKREKLRKEIRKNKIWKARQKKLRPPTPVHSVNVNKEQIEPIKEGFDRKAWSGNETEKTS